jgi:hypothetical protein
MRRASPQSSLLNYQYRAARAWVLGHQSIRHLVTDGQIGYAPKFMMGLVPPEKKKYGEPNLGMGPSMPIGDKIT